MILDMQIKNGWVHRSIHIDSTGVSVTTYGPISEVRLGSLFKINPKKVYRLVVEEVK